MLEQDAGQPILQLSSGWLFGSDEGEVALAVLCPRTFSVFSLRRTFLVSS